MRNLRAVVILLACVVTLFLLPSRENSTEGNATEVEKASYKALVGYCWLRKTPLPDGPGSTFLTTKLCEELQNAYKEKYHEKPVDWR